MVIKHGIRIWSSSMVSEYDHEAWCQNMVIKLGIRIWSSIMLSEYGHQAWCQNMVIKCLWCKNIILSSIHTSSIDIRIWLSIFFNIFFKFKLTDVIWLLQLLISSPFIRDHLFHLGARIYSSSASLVQEYGWSSSAPLCENKGISICVACAVVSVAGLYGPAGTNCKHHGQSVDGKHWAPICFACPIIVSQPTHYHTKHL